MLLLQLFLRCCSLLYYFTNLKHEYLCLDCLYTFSCYLVIKWICLNISKVINFTLCIQQEWKEHSTCVFLWFLHPSFVLMFISCNYKSIIARANQQYRYFTVYKQLINSACVYVHIYMYIIMPIYIYIYICIYIGIIFSFLAFCYIYTIPKNV